MSTYVLFAPSFDVFLKTETFWLIMEFYHHNGWINCNEFYLGEIS
jgi:hypothetical protein